MIVPCKRDRVAVDRNGQKFEATITHALHMDVKDGEGNVIPDKAGAFLGAGIRTDSGFDLYAQMGQLSPIGETA